ncbi:MAG TPA: hypothetical protein VHC96_02970, partial [Puia sp.]|nr:hypothetical protein [Puia sp.]
MQPIPPETKHEVSATELIAAISGGKFHAYSWFYKTTKPWLLADKELASYTGWLDNDEDLEYIVLKEAKCELPAHESLFLHKLGGSTPKIGLIFYKSLLPGVLVKDTGMHDWLLINTHVGSILIASNSRIGEINIRENSRAGNIAISDSSVMKNVRIDKNSQAGNISIYSKSQCGDVYISENSHTWDINFEDSQVGDIAIKHNSKCANLHIRGSKVETIRIEENSEAMSVGILGDSQCDGAFVKQGQVGELIAGDSKISHIYFYES